MTDQLPPPVIVLADGLAPTAGPFPTTFHVEHLAVDVPDDALAEFDNLRARLLAELSPTFLEHIEAIHQSVCVLPYHALADCPGATS